MQILKRDGRKVEFDRQKIVNAIKKSFRSVDGEVSDYASEKAENIADYITQRVNESDKPFDVEMIQDLVEHGLMSCKRKDVAKAVESYLHEIYDYNKDLIDDVLYDLYEENYIVYTDIYQVEYADKCVNYTNTALSLSLLHDRNMLSNQIYGKLFYELSYDKKMEVIKKVNLKHHILSHHSAFALYSDIDTLRERL